jgi:hypothetical protein
MVQFAALSPMNSPTVACSPGVKRSLSSTVALGAADDAHTTDALWPRPCGCSCIA